MMLVFATTNPHKAREVAEMLAPCGIEVIGLTELGVDIPPPDEDASTFEGNARIKAITYAQAAGSPCLADDSGLEVDALGGAPGVHSARYAGVGGTRDERDKANREKLISELIEGGHLDRAARLVCALCLADAQGRILFEARGTLAGVIVDQPQGEHGFGYDTHLFLEDAGLTAAELPPEEMNARSHRGTAMGQLLSWVQENSPHLESLQVTRDRF